MIDGSSCFTWNFSDCSMALPDSATATQLCRRFHQCTLHLPLPGRLSTVLNYTSSLLMLFFVQALLRNCYKLPSIVAFTFIRLFDQNFVSFTEQSQSCRVCLIQHQNSRYFWCPVWKTKSWQKRQTYMKTETCKLCSTDFWIFLPNIIKIDRYNFEHRLPFQSWAVFLRHSVVRYRRTDCAVENDGSLVIVEFVDERGVQYWSCRRESNCHMTKRWGCCEVEPPSTRESSNWVTASWHRVLQADVTDDRQTDGQHRRDR